VGFISSSTSFTRFQIPEAVAPGLYADAINRLKKFAFRDIDESAEERSFGWVSMENMLDSRWSAAPPEKGEYLAFTMRLDTRRVAPAVFKKHLQIALLRADAEAKEQGRKGISRERKKELKEQVRLKLMARALPVPAVFDVVWNTTTSVVYLATTNSKVCDMFINLFTDTFELHLEPLSPYHLAVRLVGTEAQARLEQVEPVRFV